MQLAPRSSAILWPSAPGHWSSDRIIAMCQALRRIMEVHLADQHKPQDEPDWELAALAYIWADHAEWRP